jgi:hypothetical protein
MKPFVLGRSARERSVHEQKKKTHPHDGFEPDVMSLKPELRAE